MSNDGELVNFGPTEVLRVGVGCFVFGAGIVQSIDRITDRSREAITSADASINPFSGPGRTQSLCRAQTEVWHPIV